ncbi:MAG: DUF2059 domain-containing protein [Xanthomonadaceae bacterium]|nr:DUF2059 domain-containing protein [Xanthomonadaceae bacterium]
MLRTRAAALLLCVLSPLAAPAALAAEPTDAQVDRLIETMDMRRLVDDMFTQIDAMGLQMGEQFLGDDATPEKREQMRRVLAKQHEAMRKTMSWDKLGPIYRNVYRKLFTADEIDAMIAFYGSETGRGILRKMPQAMELSMQEMQPIMQTLIADMQKSIEAEVRTLDDARPIDPPPPAD